MTDITETTSQITDLSQSLRKKIAVIGTGISGMGLAYLLNPHHDITVYEKESYIGGHSRTIDINVDSSSQTVSVDTGFIVFNHRNYPHLTAMFDQLNVPVAKSNMSFGISINDGWLEYGTRKLPYLLAQKRNLLRPKFWRMINDILTFNKQALAFVEKNPQASMQQCLDDLGMQEWFKHYYLLAMGGAIWSTPLQEMLKFPAKTMIQFFDNHGLLTVNDQPQWFTVQGGSRSYVSRLTASFANKIRLNCGVKRVIRTEQGVIVEDTQGNSEQYDEVIFACHSDQAIAMIEKPTTEEQQILGNVHYLPNRVIVHSDLRFMPKRKQAWSSWVYLSREREDQSNTVSLTYWMNNLQPINCDKPILVTLNPTELPDPKLTYDDHWFDHPQFDQSAINAQQRIEEIQGKDRLWFCGAWQRYGFHEDGLASAVNVAAKFGIKAPWLD